MDRIYFSHVRNIRFCDENGSFCEVAHRASEGDVDTVGIMKAYAEAGYEGYIRPDHGRHCGVRTRRKANRGQVTGYMIARWESNIC
jgi:D-mannonate dehydratase